jgi:hypothetical protein
MVYNPAMRWAACIVISFLTAAAGHSEPSVTLCDLLKNSEKYNGKEVTERATWRYGFEWSQFYCIDCLEHGLTWLDVPADVDDGSNKILKRIPAAGIVNVTVHGIFMSGGHFGHLGYPHQLVAQKVSDIAVSGMKSRAKEKELETRFACGGQNPK